MTLSIPQAPAYCHTSALLLEEDVAPDFISVTLTRQISDLAAMAESQGVPLDWNRLTVTTRDDVVPNSVAFTVSVPVLA